MSKFRNPPNTTIWDPQKYLQKDLYPWLKALADGLLSLDFIDNFNAFLAENVEIPAGETKDIPNGFYTRIPGLIPTKRLIVRQTGNGVITDGSWDATTVRLTNNGAVTVVLSVIFLR